MLANIEEGVWVNVDDVVAAIDTSLTIDSKRRERTSLLMRGGHNLSVEVPLEAVIDILEGWASASNDTD